MKRMDFFILPFLMDLAVAVSQLMVNLRALDLGASALTIGVLLGICWGLPYVAVSIATGRTVGRIGARWTMVLGAVLFAVSVAGYGAARSTWLLLVAAPFGGAGSALFWPALQTCLPAETPDETSARSGVFNVSWTLGILLGGAGAGHLYRLSGPHASFYAVSALIGLEAVVIAMRARQTVRPAPPGTSTSGATAGQGRAKALLLMARASNFALWFLGAAAGAVFPRIARALGVDDGSIGEIAAAVWVGQVVAFAWVSRGAWWQGRVIPLACALAVGIAAMGLLAWAAGRSDLVRDLNERGLAVNWQTGFLASSTVAFVAGFSLVGIARALTHAASMHYSLTVGPSPEANMGYHEAIIGIGFVLGPLAAGFAADELGLQAPFVMSALVGAAALALVLGVGRRLPGTAQ